MIINYSDENYINWYAPAGVYRATCIEAGFKAFKRGKLQARFVFRLHIDDGICIEYRAQKIYKNFYDDKRLRKDLVTWFGKDPGLSGNDLQRFCLQKEAWVKLKHRQNEGYTEPFREIVSIHEEDPRAKKKRKPEPLLPLEELSRRIEECRIYPPRSPEAVTLDQIP